MSLARTTLSGIVKKNPEKRFTSNNVTLTTFLMDFSENGQEESIIPISAFGNLGERVANEISKGDKIVVDGKLQMVTLKSDDGLTEKKIAQVDLSSYEKISTTVNQNKPNENVVKFAEEEYLEDEDLLGADEIPF